MRENVKQISKEDVAVIRKNGNFTPAFCQPCYYKKMALVIADFTVQSQTGQYFLSWIAFLDNDLTRFQFRF